MKLSNQTKAFDAILLAGEGESSFKVYHQHKAFLRIQGTCIVNHVIQSLRQVPSIRSIYVVGQKETLLQTLKEGGVDLNEPKPIHLVQQRENLYQNIWHTFLATLPGDAKDEPLEAGPYRERPVLIVPCDAPLITPSEIEYFIQNCDLDRYDHVLGLTPESCLEPFYPEPGKAGIRMAYLHLKENNYRINNLHLVKPIKIGHRDYIQQMYQYRYQRNIKNVIPFALKLLWEDRHRGYHYYLGLIFSLLFSNFNCPSLVRFFKSWVPREGLEDWISKGLDTRFKSLETPFPGAALDIDNEHDFESMKSRFQDWKKYLADLETTIPKHQEPPVNPALPLPTPFSQLTKTLG